jgi:hypothetical protein
MADEHSYAPGKGPRPPRQPIPGELLFEFHVLVASPVRMGAEQTKK